jgi:hypothetical protein
MVVFELSPEDVLTFDVEDISDTMQSSIALSCSDTTDNSLVLFAVSSNPPFRYSITPDTGFLLTSEPCVMSVTLSNLGWGWSAFSLLFLVITSCQITLQLWLIFLLAVMLAVLPIYQQQNSQMPLGNTSSPTQVLLLESYLWSIISLQTCRC